MDSPNSAKGFVSNLFQCWEAGDSAPFFAALAEEVTWNAAGTTPISGIYHGKSNYLEKVYQPLLAIFTGPTSCRIKRIFGEGQVVIVEWHVDTPTALGFVYSQEYCWLIQVNEKGSAIAEVTGYFDTALVDRLFRP